jgi:hypothetical protein
MKDESYFYVNMLVNDVVAMIKRRLPRLPPPGLRWKITDASRPRLAESLAELLNMPKEVIDKVLCALRYQQNYLTSNDVERLAKGLVDMMNAV